jgi:O-antigen/teichoic acid export membrane protein
MSVERAARNVGWVFGAYIVRRLVRLGYLAAFARVLKPYGFGSYVFLLSLVETVAGISALGLNLFLTRRLNRDRADAPDFVSRVFSLNLVSAALFTVGLLVVASFTRYDPDVQFAMVLMGLTVLPLALIAMMHATSAAYERLWIFALLDNATPLVEAAVGLVLLLTGFRLVGLCTLHLVLYCLYAVVFFVLMRRRILRFTLAFDWSAWVSYFRESWKIWAFSAQALLYVNLGVILLSVLTGNRNVGYFGAAVTLMEVIRTASNSFSWAVFPYMVRAWHRDPEELRSFQESCVRLIAAAAVPAGILGITLTQPVVRLLFGEQYLASVRVLQILSWMVFPLMFDQIMPQACFAAGRSLLPVLGHGIVNTLRVVLSVVFVIWFADRSAEGLAWAQLMTGFACFIVYAMLIRRYVYAFAPAGPLARVALAAAAPVLLLFVLQGRMNVFLLAALALTAFAAGAYVFRVFTAREFEIIRRAVLSFRTRTPDVVRAETETGDEPDA